MKKLKTAEARPSKGDEELGVQDAAPCVKQGPSRLALLYACMNFVGGVGRLLDVAAKVYKWTQNDS